MKDMGVIDLIIELIYINSSHELHDKNFKVK